MYSGIIFIWPFSNSRKCNQIDHVVSKVSEINHGIFGIKRKICSIYILFTEALRRMPLHIGQKGQIV